MKFIGKVLNHNEKRYDEIPVEVLKGANLKSIVGVDCSTAGTGISMVSMETGLIEATLFTKQDKQSESLVEYRIRMKEGFKNFLRNNPGIFLVVYEPPIVGINAHTTGILFTLKGFAEEAVLELNKEENRGLTYVEYINTKWKKHFFEPEHCPSATKLAKEAIKNRLFTVFREQGIQSGFDTMEQDELDASAMAFAYRKLIISFREDEAITKKKQRPFAYDYEIVCAENEEQLFTRKEKQEVLQALPKRLREQDILVKDWEDKKLLEKFLFQDIAGLDLVIAYKTKVQNIGKLILERKLKELAKTPEATVYVVAWRKNPITKH